MRKRNGMGTPGRPRARKKISSKKRTLKKISSKLTSLSKKTIKSIPITLTIQEAQDLRTDYMNIIEDPELKLTFFQEIATKFQQLTSTDCAKSPAHLTFAFKTHDGSYGEVIEDYTSNQSFLLVGRDVNADIKSPEHAECISRIHCILLGTDEEFFLVDLCSFNGTRVKQSLNSEQIEEMRSMPDERRILKFSTNDSVVLSIGDEGDEIWINPKQCGICEEYPRTVAWNCGHAYACQECAKDINQCPLCRKQNVEPVFRKKVAKVKSYRKKRAARKFKQKSRKKIVKIKRKRKLLFRKQSAKKK